MDDKLKGLVLDEAAAEKFAARLPDEGIMRAGSVAQLDTSSPADSEVNQTH
ncbi:hypothetical protein NE236_00895 [Actinoallomurus purpureus]|uniref:hypothetical protein n=1 Tax=Actinoallomurus purpureus TaxID=478114 RepID=UPI0020929F13|nr:hypothetical protein [Actinoallomurus purpureus]MCO6003534.1 hypothetical protein [Actinoallomurus purpureus]